MATTGSNENRNVDIIPATEYERELEKWQQEAQQHAQPSTGTIDVATFVKAQSEFIKAQTYFLMHRAGNCEERLHATTQFSVAQGAYIAAQNQVLADLGVV